MIKKNNQTEKLLLYIKNKIKEMNCKKIIWLGYSPGFVCVYKMLVENGLTNIKIMDNDKNKQGWIIKPLSGFKYPDIAVQAFKILKEDNDALFLVANTHYKEFVNQLSEFGIKEENIIDLFGIMEQWMWDIEKPIVSNYKRLIGRELQLEQLKILKYFRDFCDSNDLKWFLGEGTLLGAVRHKGFIPWDDDIDVFMPFEDYIKCIEKFPKNESYSILDWRTDRQYPFQFAKVVKKGTYQIHSIPFGYFTLGCYIDIFPIAGFPDDEQSIMEKYQRHRVLDAKWDSTLILRDLYGDKYEDCRQKITDEKYKLSFYNSKRVGTMQQIAGNAWAVPQEVFSESIDMQFEDDYFPVPIGYDAFLTARYGDYMTPPPVEKRRIHSYPTYKINKRD